MMIHSRFVFALLVATTVGAFVPGTRSIPSLVKAPIASSSSSRLHVGGSADGWHLPNDFRMFLNQCSIQSFMFLLRQMRDVQTVRWLEQFTQPNILEKESDLREDPSNYESGAFVATPESKTNIKLLQYHGLAAMNTTLFPTWDSYFLELLDQPEQTFRVKALQSHIPSYDLDIDPPSLCTRLISVREQIAHEWVKDLSVIASMGGHTLDSYWDAIERQKEDGLQEDPEKVYIARENLLFLEWSADDEEGDDFAPSPLRKGNFDLLVLLTTQEAIHRVLNDKTRKDGLASMNAHYLGRFYSEKLSTHFFGIQKYGRADDLMEELLTSTPIAVQYEDKGAGLVDPTRIAEEILAEREKVALEWQELARTSSAEHFELRKLSLNRRMGVGASSKKSRDGETRA